MVSVVKVTPRPQPEPEPTYTIEGLSWEELDAVRSAMATAARDQAWRVSWRDAALRVYDGLRGVRR